MTRLVVYAADGGACGHYRCVAPAAALARQGVEVSVVEPGSDDALPIVVLAGTEVLVREMPEADVIVIQRPMGWQWTKVIPQFRRAGIEVIVELDDDVRSVHPGHVAYHGMHPRWSRQYNWDHLEINVGLADRFVCTTEALVRRYRHPDTVIVPNYLPRSFLVDDAPPADDRGPADIVIGWPGRVGTHPADLDACEQAVGRLQRQLGFTFKVVGDPTWVRRALGLSSEPVSHPWVPYEDYPAALSTFDIGIAPLGPHIFNEAKSWLKPLEFAGRGLPFVCSPSEPYRAFCSHGAGLVASGRRGWADGLRAYVTSGALRAAHARRNLDVARRLVLEDHLDEWLHAWAIG